MLALALNLTRLKSIASQDGRPKRLADGGGLYIEATPAGSKLWKMAYRFGGRQKTLSLGAWPAVSLVDARALQEQAKKLLAEGKDPGAAKKALKAGGAGKTFDEWAGEYIYFRTNDPKSRAAGSTIDKFEWSRAAVRRQIGGSPITDITIPEIIAAIRAIEGTGKLHKSTKAKTFISQVFRYAAGSGVQVMDPGRIISDAVMRPAERHHAAITDPAKLGEMLRAIDGYSGDASVRYALMLAPHVFLRDAEIRSLRWGWIRGGVIEIPVGGATKLKNPHLVPLSRQVLDLVEEIRQFSGRQEYLFPSGYKQGSALSSNTLNSALRRLGFTKDEATFHGFRTTASTLLREVPPATRHYSDEAIERQLSHADKNRVRAAYDKSDRLDERASMLQVWSDLLDDFRRLPPVS